MTTSNKPLQTDPQPVLTEDEIRKQVREVLYKNMINDRNAIQEV